jgi:hypothetical protein
MMAISMRKMKKSTSKEYKTVMTKRKICSFSIFSINRKKDVNEG